MMIRRVFAALSTAVRKLLGSERRRAPRSPDEKRREGIRWIPFGF